MTGSGAEDAFVESAREAFRREPGFAALDALGVPELFDELADRDARAALFAVFRAHGRELGRSARRGDVLVLLGEPTTEHVLVDRPGAGASLYALADVAREPVAIAGRLPVHEIAIDEGAAKSRVPEERAVEARRRSAFLGRVAAAHEIVGAAEGALDLALGHAVAREQFGVPIGSFQAVRHLLAWARTDCAAALEVSRQAAALDLAAPPHFDEIAKALAGRNGRRICERSLQVLGAIGFTAEQPHHHFHSRVLALDAVLGSSAELARGLGAWLRESRTDPQIPRQLLQREVGP